MNDVVIRVENLSKLYRLGELHKQTNSFREKVSNSFSRILHGANHKASNPMPSSSNAMLHAPSTLRSSQSDDHIWALRDVSFEVKRGEIVGIIGRNGAGKSTLLKILSRITKPTEGTAWINGPVGSLLEVGTGFHAELTGRENIFLNGAILGMTKAEIRRKFDEIVHFAEVDKFIDTPVKRYSSGMYVRLAFAVAAHLEQEILLVDEVLAVGDIAFQKRCLGKMGSIVGEGRTVLFVSHNMQAIRRLCDRVVVLKAGNLVQKGDVDESINIYMQDVIKVEAIGQLQEIIRKLPPDSSIRILNARLIQNGEDVIHHIANGSPLEIQIHYQVLKRTTGLRVFFDLCDSEDNLLFRSFNDEQSEGIPTMDPGEYISKAIIPANLLAPSHYELRISATVFNIRMCVPDNGIIIPLDVERTGLANKAYVIEPIRGKLAPIIPWTTSAC